jgi:hypothetical protein
VPAQQLPGHSRPPLAEANRRRTSEERVTNIEGTAIVEGDCRKRRLSRIKTMFIRLARPSLARKNARSRPDTNDRRIIFSWDVAAKERRRMHRGGALIAAVKSTSTDRRTIDTRRSRTVAAYSLAAPSQQAGHRCAGTDEHETKGNAIQIAAPR